MFISFLILLCQTLRASLSIRAQTQRFLPNFSYAIKIKGKKWIKICIKKIEFEYEF